MASVVPYVWWFLMASLLVGAVVMSRFYRRLRVHHPETWKELGSPTLILNSSIANQHRVRRFLWKGEYRQLRDPTLSSICKLANGVGILGLIAFLISVLLISIKGWQ